jgi:hypothetical protein
VRVLAIVIELVRVLILGVVRMRLLALDVDFNATGALPVGSTQSRR